MRDKIQNAIKDMESKVVFQNEKGQHRYVLADTGEWIQGVSTVSSIIPKDWLAAWGAKECVKALGFDDYGDKSSALKMLVKIKEMDVEEYFKLLQYVKGAAFRKSKDAMLDGTKGHAWLEDYVKAKIDGTELPRLPDDFLERPIRQFLEWEENNVEAWYVSEAKVVNVEHRYAGTLDAIAKLKDGSLAIIDFKFATNISEDYYLQEAGYAACFEKYDIKFDKRLIIRLPKTLEKDEWDEKKWKYYKVENKIEVHEVPTKYEYDRDVFFNALPLKQWVNYVIKLNK